MNSDVQNYPLVGSIQNSVGMGFIGNQTVYAIANALGARVIHAPTSYASAHTGLEGRSRYAPDPALFRKDVAFLISRRPAVLIVGYVPGPNFADIIANQLQEYKGVVLLDPVIGDYQKGLYVTSETARAIRDYLVPVAQIITPNRFEAEVLLGLGGSEETTEYAFLNGLYDLGPKAVAITSFAKDLEKRRLSLLFTNGYAYYRITAPYYATFPAHGSGDTFAGAMGVLVALGGSPLAGALLATVLCARAVANSTAYGGGTVDPVSALEKWKPQGYQMDDDRAIQFAARSNVDIEIVKPGAEDNARLKFAPPKNRITYG